MELSKCLKKIAEKFITNKTTIEKEETDSRHAYDMLMQNLNSQTPQGEKDRDSKAEDKARSET